MIRGIILFLLSTHLFSADFFYEFGKKVELKPTSEVRDLNTTNKIYHYKTTSGRDIKFKNEIITKVKDSIDAKSFFNTLGITKYSKISDNTYLIILNKKQNIFTLSQKLYESGKTVYATPNIVQKYIPR